MFHNGLFQQSKLSTSARLNKDGMNRWFVAKPSRHANMKTNHQLINTLPMETKHKPTIHDPFHLFHQPFSVYNYLETEICILNEFIHTDLLTDHHKQQMAIDVPFMQQLFEMQRVYHELKNQTSVSQIMQSLRFFQIIISFIFQGYAKISATILTQAKDLRL